MKKANILFVLLLFSVVSVAQGIRYDTIKVSPGDERNIHRGATLQTSKQTTIKTKSSNTKGYYDNVLGSGYSLDASKFRYGADIGLYFSRNYSSFNLGPQVGYLLSEHVMLGVGAKYYYLKTRGYSYQQETVYKNNLLGVNAFGYFYPTRYTVLFAQPEINHMWSLIRDEVTGESRRISGFVPAFLIGGGLRLGVTHVTLNYDLGRHRNSPYSRGLFLGFSIFL